jgi:hypothetical protein
MKWQKKEMLELIEGYRLTEYRFDRDEPSEQFLNELLIAEFLYSLIQKCANNFKV